MEKNIHCTLTDQELAVKADKWIDELIASGGKAFTMQVPARPNADTDLIFAELNNRFKKLISQQQPSSVWVKEKDRLPGWNQPVKWRLGKGPETERKIALSEMTNSYGIENWQWLDESPAEQPVADNAHYELSLALRMLLKVFKNDQITNDQEKYYSQAEAMLKKHSSIYDVLRTGTAEQSALPTFWDVAKVFKWAAEYNNEKGESLNLSVADGWFLVDHDDNTTEDLTPGNVAELYCLQKGFDKNEQPVREVGIINWLNEKGWKPADDGTWYNFITQQYNVTPEKIAELFKQKAASGEKEDEK